MRNIPAILMIFIFIFTLLLDSYILWDIVSYCRRRKKLCIGIHVAISILFLGLVIAIACWHGDSESRSIIPLMWMLYVYASVYVPKLIYCICSGIGRLFKSIRKGRKINYGIYIGAPVSLIVFIFMWWGTLFTRNEIVVENVNIVSDKVPSAFDGYRIVQFSDAHVGTWGNDTAFVSRLVDRINSMEPELIVFTGDIVNRETSEMEPFLRIFSRLHARDGVYSVLGNHDYGDYMEWQFASERDSNNALMAMWQKQIGWNLMNNDRKYITHNGDSIVLIGIENWGEPPFHQYGRLTDAYPLCRDSVYNLNDERFKILLSHNPEHWNREVSKITNVDLTLSGHTHAMQMAFDIFGYEWSPSKWRYPQWKGLYERENENGDTTRLYVNIGCGEVGIPARFGTAYPELTQITLKRK